MKDPNSPNPFAMCSKYSLTSYKTFEILKLRFELIKRQLRARKGNSEEKGILWKTFLIKNCGLTAQ